MKKKGFTLVELLAVIIILGVIAIIVTPIVNNTINDAARDTFKETAEAIVREMRNYATRQEMETGFPYENQLLDVKSEELKYKGDRSSIEAGKVFIDGNGRVAIEMNDGTYCARKAPTDEGVTVENLRSQTCDGSNLASEYSS